ncbi:CPBP family intramembrane glutamic endopeptidase [Nonomuraea jabiensis]|uniref:Membrane protease YdiL (CAAX protease family) n=1 Tax=Nonomuraea jabiensis TaxID=882448 RepID=A0A7W9GD62_9ACTN|nr:CPBP family intramembrane glutamic endopeptidase [Nonomuraea jabiensis]MBB5781623.1 membrane protease YdiL (CAAX protease family) [Nonomuraea jabiensis]
MDLIATAIWALFLISVLITVVARLRGLVLLGFGVRRPGVGSELGKGFLIVTVAMLALFGVLVAMGATTVTGVALRADVIWNGLAAFLSWAVLEEVVSRMGLLLALLVLTRRPWLALTVSSLAFGSVHLVGGDGTLLGAVSSTLGGFMYGLALLRTGRLWMPIAMHFAWNFVQGSILGYPVSGEHRLGVPFLAEHDVVGGLLTLHDNGPSLITGGSYGPEGGWPSLLVRALIILGVLATTHSGRPLLHPAAERE